MTDFDRPFMPANQGCFDLVLEVAPQLSRAFAEELRPIAKSAAAIEERVRELHERGERLLAEFREDAGERAAWELGRAWSCCVEDLVATAVDAAAAQIAGDAASASERRARLQRLEDDVYERWPDSLTITTAAMRLGEAQDALN